MPIENKRSLAQHVLVYGISLSVLIFLIKWIQWTFLLSHRSTDAFVGIIALFFTLFGAWCALQFSRRLKTEQNQIGSTYSFSICHDESHQAMGLSQRELEVLQLLAIGQSNADIARKLYISVSTVKSHVSQVLSKLNVKNRTQAVAEARKAGILEQSYR